VLNKAKLLKATTNLNNSSKQNHRNCVRFFWWSQCFLKFLIFQVIVYVVTDLFEILLQIQSPPLWSSGQSSWLQIQRSGFDYRHYHIFREVVGLERGPLSFVSTIEELFERKSSGSVLESREYGRRDPLCWPRGTLYLQKLSLTSPTTGGRSVGIVSSRTRTREFFYWRFSKGTFAPALIKH
jgi:hypothetical protein